MTIVNLEWPASSSKRTDVQLVQVEVLYEEGALAKKDALLEIEAVAEAWCLMLDA